MDFTALRYFSATAHSRSIRAASDRLHVSPSAIYDTHLHGLIRTFPPTLTTKTLNHRRLERFDTRL
jgi:hypothetical protein